MSTTTVEPAKLVADIIQTEMGLAAGQVMITNQRWPIPNDQRIYVVVSYDGPSRQIGNNNRFEPTDAGGNEVQEASVMHGIKIDLMSFGDEARVRKEEIPMALGSIYAQQQQAKYGMRVSEMTAPLMPDPTLEGTGQLNRFTTFVNVYALHKKVKSAQYYDTFQEPEVHVNE